MYKRINFLFLVLLGFPSFIICMKQPEKESQFAYFDRLPSEIKLEIFFSGIKNIVDQSNDIFEAQTKLTESNFLKNIIFIDKDFAVYRKNLKKYFLRLLSEKFPNQFINQTIEENNEQLKEIFKQKPTPELEIEAGKAILAGADVNLIVNSSLENHSFSDDPLLIEAVKLNYKRLVQFLLERGANKNITNGLGDTALMTAISFNHVEMIPLLIKYGANVNITNKKGLAPLHKAIIKNFPDIVDILLENKAYPDIKNSSLDTPLMLAVFYNQPRVVKALLKYPIDLDGTNVDGDSALTLAKKYKNIELKKLLKDARKKAKKCILC